MEYINIEYRMRMHISEKLILEDSEVRTIGLIRLSVSTRPPVLGVD